MSRHLLRVKIYIDGGARGNPGPAAAGVVIKSSDDDTELFKGGFFIGQATNNVAEYRGLIEGLSAAGRLGAAEVEIVSDSQLLVRQMIGEYRVKNEGLKPLHEQAGKLARGFKSCTFRHVMREENKDADGLVNQAMNLKSNVEDAAGLRPYGTSP